MDAGAAGEVGRQRQRSIQHYGGQAVIEGVMMRGARGMADRRARAGRRDSREVGVAGRRVRGRGASNTGAPRRDRPLGDAGAGHAGADLLVGGGGGNDGRGGEGAGSGVHLGGPGDNAGVRGGDLLRRAAAADGLAQLAPERQPGRAGRGRRAAADAARLHLGDRLRPRHPARVRLSRRRAPDDQRLGGWARRWKWSRCDGSATSTLAAGRRSC